MAGDSTEAIDMGSLLQEDTEDALRVRYTGRADRRILTVGDLSGQGGGEWMQLVWVPNSEIDWSFWLGMAGDDDRAREVLKAHRHEFELVGPGADTFWDAEEEVIVGGSE